MAHLGTLIVKANVDGAELWLNGERLGQLPMSRVRAPSGTIHIEVRAKDHEPALRNLDLEPGTTITTEIVLQRVPEAAPPIVVQSALPSDTPSAPAPATNVKRTLAWGALGGSVLMLGGALTAQAIHDQAANTWNDLHGARPMARRQVRRLPKHSGEGANHRESRLHRGERARGRVGHPFSRGRACEAERARRREMVACGDGLERHADRRGKLVVTNQRAG